ncbi:hypothetical protein SAMN05444372_11299 [Flavobacterium micromati]|uniref:Uncharacterized protein n=1 Tax=Flavobacterium micromati TaxID=229205 RepID=A0A1M5P807_9FLAO|nr:hypothetical protein SAMN05444372_11299 [Flavobacterium micromati]
MELIDRTKIKEIVTYLNYSLQQTRGYFLTLDHFKKLS